VLTRAHVLTSKMMRKNRRIAIVVLACLAAALPGTDPVSMLLELLPLLILFEISIWVARGVERSRARDAAALTTDDTEEA
jgi:sec-independent protein translocase protein TatC